VRSKSYCIKVKPIAWQRAARNSNRYFDAQAKDKLAHGLYLINQHGDEPLFEGPIRLQVIFFMAIPKTLQNRQHSVYHSKSPDLDNLIKFLLDAMTDVIIADDRIICSLDAIKVYDVMPRTEFIITEVK